MKWVRLNRYLELSGETRNSFRHLQVSGLLAEGVHYRHDHLKRVWVNVEEMERWVEGRHAVFAPDTTRRRSRGV